jgi:hypothetical protein
MVMDVEVEKELEVRTPISILESAMEQAQDTLYRMRSDTPEENSRRIDTLANAVAVALQVLIHERTR